MLKHSNFNYKVKGSRSENCVLIDTKNWYVNTSNTIIGFDTKGGVANTYITEALAENLTKYEGEVKAGDVIMITAVAAKLYGARPFHIPINMDNTKYTDVPFAHIIGKFDKKISFDTFQLLGNYLLLERLTDVDTDENGLCLTTNHTNSVYRVIKKSKGAEIDSEVILLRDNVTTPIMLEGTQYFAASAKDVVAGFNVKAGGYTVENISTVYNQHIVLEDYQTPYANEGTTIFKATTDVEANEWISEAYNENRFKVVLSGNPKLQKDEIIYAIRESLEYCTLNGIKYYVVDNTKFIIAKLKEEK